MDAFATPEEEWRAYLEGRHPHLFDRTAWRFIPSSPRCKLCKVPFRAPGGLVSRRMGIAPWAKNPKLCDRCFEGLSAVAQACPRRSADDPLAGAEVELSMLFADVRGSSRIARTMPPTEFTRLMQRFYTTSTDVLIDADAIIEKFVGDEVVGLFIPILAGSEHPRRAVEAATALLVATGHSTPGGPWVPIGAAVHTGTAFVGIVASGGRATDFTALGDAMNLAAHLSSQAAAGEILVTDEAAAGAGLAVEGRERRHLSLKGHPADAFVLRLDDRP